ncbi:helix-turn-helix transcriptional regulator [Streptomyces blastmyceticus]|uniref:Helix-turn-helix transcriptional regulator n=2 Tax=Streptomyces blastmyceticus TaxID=68180 RepID=A0ABP3HHZ0_9ACTN
MERVKHMAEETGPAPDPTRSLLAFFGSETSRLRGEAGMSQEALAEKAHTTQSMISKVEAAKRVPSKDLARDLDAALKTGGHFGRLHPLMLTFAYPSWFLPYVELEQDATSIRAFQGQVVPGLLQTEEYARAMLEAVRAVNLDDTVAVRMSRQAIFEREVPPTCWFVIDEPVLLRPIGGTEVMRAQLEKLLEVGADPRNVIQVIPRQAGAHPGLAGPFTLMGFDEGADVLYIDGFSQGRMALEPREIAEAVHTYDLLRAVALPPKESADLIREHLKEPSS